MDEVTQTQQMATMSALIDEVMLKARQAGVSNMAVAVSFQIASVEVAKVGGVSDQAIEQGFVIAMEQAETAVAQAIRMRIYAH